MMIIDGRKHYRLMSISICIKQVIVNDEIIKSNAKSSISNIYNRRHDKYNTKSIDVKIIKNLYKLHVKAIVS